LETLDPAAQFRAYHATLFRAWGRPHWWPARSRFEVIVGAYLTQNTAWTNVERALRQLRAARALSVNGIRNTPPRKLQALIRSSGYFRQKAQRLKTFVAFLDQHYRGSLDRMFAQPTSTLREQLLSLNGVGPETADSILLYAGQHPVFVVDAYTRRILERHGIVPANAPYEKIRAFCEGSLNAKCSSSAREADSPPIEFSRNHNPQETAANAGACHAPSPMSLAARAPLAQIYNDMHGLIIGVGKNYCLKSKPKCDECPLQKFLPGVK